VPGISARIPEYRASRRYRLLGRVVQVLGFRVEHRVDDRVGRDLYGYLGSPGRTIFFVIVFGIALTLLQESASAA